jgi:hypothetical protein
MPRLAPLDVTLLPGAQTLLEHHARELPQRDDLCGAFCGSVALRAAGIEQREGEPVDQDAVAVAAGSVVSRHADPGILPDGESGRRDYRLALPFVDDANVSGTTASGLVEALQGLSDARIAAIPYTGPWMTETLGGIFEAAAALDRPATLIANLATRQLWGSRPGAAELLAYLYEGTDGGPAPDWDVGHFTCVVGRLQGPRGSLYVLADTYPSLGTRGVHLQPQERLATALERPDMAAGGMIAVVSAEDAPLVRSRADALGLREGVWDNGTVTQATLR